VGPSIARRDIMGHGAPAASCTSASQTDSWRKPSVDTNRQFETGQRDARNDGQAWRVANHRASDQKLCQLPAAAGPGVLQDADEEKFGSPGLMAPSTSAGANHIRTIEVHGGVRDRRFSGGKVGEDFSPTRDVARIIEHTIQVSPEQRPERTGHQKASSGKWTHRRHRAQYQYLTEISRKKACPARTGRHRRNPQGRTDSRTVVVQLFSPSGSEDGGRRVRRAIPRGPLRADGELWTLPVAFLFLARWDTEPGGSVQGRPGVPIHRRTTCKSQVGRGRSTSRPGLRSSASEAWHLDRRDN